MYVSPNTASLRVSVTQVDGKTVNVPDTVATIKAGSPGCTTDPATHALSCTANITVPTGNNVTFHIATYASSDGTGPVLSEATVTKTIVANAPNPVAITLGGVVSKIALSPAHIPVYADGLAHRYKITVNALDASGATIVGSENYQSPISLSVQGDANGALALSASSVPAPGNSFYLMYNAAVPLNSATVTATDGTNADGSAVQAKLDLDPLSATQSSPNQALGLTVGGAPITINVHEANFTGTFVTTLSDPAVETITVSPTDGNGNATITLTPSASNSGYSLLTISDGTITMPVRTQVNATQTSPGAPSISMYNFPIPSGYAHMQPYHLLAGPAGSSTLYFSATEDGYLGSYDIGTHAVNYYKDGFGTATPQYMQWGPDGHTIWFANGNPNGPAIGNFDTTTSTFGNYTSGFMYADFPFEMITGPDGKFYFSDRGERVPGVGVFDPNNPDAGVTIYHGGLETVGQDQPGQLTFGPDGNLWFATMACCDSLIGAFGELDMASKTISRYATGLPKGISDEENGPAGIVNDGNLLWSAGWATIPYFASIDPNTKQITVYKDIGFVEGSHPTNLVISPDRKKIWYLTFGVDPLHGVWYGVGSFDIASHRTTEYMYGPDQTKAHVWSDLQYGPDGNLYFADSVYSQPAIGEVKLH
jgi:hypothetical protein